MPYIVTLEPGVWLARGTAGDPPRTMNIKFSGEWKTEAAAKAALTRAKKFRPFRDAAIHFVV